MHAFVSCATMAHCAVCAGACRLACMHAIAYLHRTSSQVVVRSFRIRGLQDYPLDEGISRTGNS